MSTPERDPKTAVFSDVGAELGMSALLPKDNTFSFLEPATDPGDLGRLRAVPRAPPTRRGGMGYVFEAEDTHLARRVALKVMRPEFATDLNSRERFLVEARAAAGLTSDYIVTVYQVGMAGDVPFQAIQLLTGESLQDRLQREAPLSVELATLILRHVAEGLAVAHEKGLIHRDIKPANIWLESSRPAGSFRRARILDFGLARADTRETKLTATGMIVGTPHYMAPEQASGQAVDGRSDVFSLGCVAYSMLTGEMAFDGSSTMAVLMALATHTPPDVSAQKPNRAGQVGDSRVGDDGEEPRATPVVGSGAVHRTGCDPERAAGFAPGIGSTFRSHEISSGAAGRPVHRRQCGRSNDCRSWSTRRLRRRGSAMVDLRAGALSLVAVAIALFAVFGKFGRDGAGHNPEGPPPGARANRSLSGSCTRRRERWRSASLRSSMPRFWQSTRSTKRAECWEGHSSRFS